MILISLLVVALVLTLSSMRGQGFIKWNRLQFFIWQQRWLIIVKTYRFVRNVQICNKNLILCTGEVFFSRLYRARSRLPLQLVCASWCIMALIIVNLYSTTLMAHITARKMMDPPKGAIQLMEEGIFSYLVFANGIGREVILVFGFKMYWNVFK